MPFGKSGIQRDFERGNRAVVERLDSVIELLSEISRRLSDVNEKLEAQGKRLDRVAGLDSDIPFPDKPDHWSERNLC